jgi:hypothetical protein
MRSIRGIATAAVLALTSSLFATCSANADDELQRYHAAMTKIFLSGYGAIPVFQLNPLSPGDVVQLDNETVVLEQKRCYASLASRRLNVQPFRSGMKIGISAKLKAEGELMSKEIAQVSAGVGATIDDEVTIKVAPIAESHVADVQALRLVGSDPGCAIIPGLLDKSVGRYVVAFAVLYGRVRFEVATKLSGQLDAKAQGALVKLIAKSFSITDADVNLSANIATALFSNSPGDLPLALIPALYSKEELARITYFMQGERGAQLEELVDAAIRTSDRSKFENAARRISNVLGLDKLEQRRERWLERFFSGEKLTPMDQLRETKEVDFGKVGTYAAAQELARPTNE